MASKQYSPVLGDVEKAQAMRHARYQAFLSRQRDSVEGRVESHLSGCEPDFITAGRPDDPYSAIPSARKGLLIASEVNYSDGIPLLKCDPIPFRRDSQAGDHAGCFTKHGSDWELEPISTVDLTGNCEPLPVRSPVSSPNILENRAWRVPGERHLGQRPLEIKAEVGRVKRNGHLARARDRKEVGVQLSERARLRAFGAG